jgi:hypothetical protein
MRRVINWLCAGAAAALLSGCVTPTVRALHAPFHPSGSDRVTFTAEAQATDGRGVTEIEIVQRVWAHDGFCAAWVAGECVPLPSMSEKTLTNCHFEPPLPSAHCEVTVEPFADGSFVTYGARMRETSGEFGSDFWIGFAVGTQAQSNEPIPVYTRGNSSTAIDIVLIPVDYDQSAGRTTRDFVNAARDFIVNGYLAQRQIDDDRDRWNFYVNPVTGGLAQTTVGTTVNRSVTQPLNWTQVASVADSVAYVHNNGGWRDFGVFGGAGIGYFTILAGTPGTIVHETGHALFGLSDEYCCDGGTTTSTWPSPNIFTDQASCQSSATAHGVATGDCVQLSATSGFCGGVDSTGAAVLGDTNGLWRQDVINDLMGCGGNGNADGGVLDAARIYWYYDQL